MLEKINEKVKEDVIRFVIKFYPNDFRKMSFDGLVKKYFRDYVNYLDNYGKIEKIDFIFETEKMV